MNHTDHVNLIQRGVTGTHWADLGSGTGAFTLALADILGATGEIYSVDRDASALKQQAHAVKTRFPQTQIHYLTADFTQKLDLPLLDGVLMANSLHFHREKAPILDLVKSYLKPQGKLLIVEYNADKGNPYVPYPFAFPTWQAIAAKAGFQETRLLATYPSRFLDEIYSAVSHPRGMGNN